MPMTLRQFKSVMDAAFNCSQAIDLAEMENFAQYLEQKGDGFIEMKNLKLIQRLQYKPAIAETKAKEISVEAETDITDILLPFKTELVNRRILPPDLFDIYDTDKNYLLSSDELVDIMENYTGYRPTEREHSILVQAIKKVSGTTGMRTQLKRAEMAQLLELIEVRQANSDAARQPLATLKKLYQEGKFVIPPAKDKDDAKLTACEFKHLLKRQGMTDQKDINVLCNHFDQLQGFVSVKELKLALASKV